MNFSANPYKLNLRRARFLQIALFGAFVYCYFAVLQGERILHFIYCSHYFSEETFAHLHPWHFALPLALLAMALLWLSCRHNHLPKDISGGKRELAFIFLAFIFCLFTSPKEAPTLEMKMQRLNYVGKYDEAIMVSKRFAHPTPGIIAERIKALAHNGTLLEDFFTYPLGDCSIKADTSYQTLNYLLDCNLEGLANYLKKHPDYHLQRAEAEALVLYNDITPHPVLIFHNTTVEANYRDYCNYRHSIRVKYHRNGERSSEAEANLMGDYYGQTYWHYYYYGHHR